MVQVGYLGKPTVVDNVESLAHATEIAIEGGSRFAKRGTRFSTGTKLLSVSGDCERPGVYEYQFGVTIGRVLEDCGAKAVSAVQIGGASGVLVTPDEFSRRIAFEDVPTAGAFMIFGVDRDIFEVARNFAHFFAHESCGFCTPCRVGTTIQRNIMDKIAEGRGSRYEVNELKRVVEFMKRTSHCGLGETAGNAVRDALEQVQAGVRAAAAREGFRAGDRSRTGARACAADHRARRRRSASRDGRLIDMAETTFTIDEMPIPFTPGQTILEAAKAAGIYIPHLCYQPGVQGARRLQDVHRARQRAYADRLHP